MSALSRKKSPFIIDPFSSTSSEPDVVEENPSGDSSSELILGHFNKFVQVINVTDLLLSDVGGLEITLRRASDGVYETGATAYIINQNDSVTDGVSLAANLALPLGAPGTFQIIMEVVGAGLAIPTTMSLQMFTDEFIATNFFNVVMDNLDLHDRIKFEPAAGTFTGNITMTRQQ